MPRKKKTESESKIPAKVEVEINAKDEKPRRIEDALKNYKRKLRRL